MDALLELLTAEARLSDAELARRTGLTEQEVREKRTTWEQEGKILGYQAVINHGDNDDDGVFAFIEVKVTPERGGGFDRLAGRIARFDEVRACFLASGGFDLLVMVQSSSMRGIANFVAEKLSTLEGVLSTSTHFHLKTYKRNGIMFNSDPGDRRLAVSP